ncbi:hypothetical protein VKT23_012917 [Stygiomarasmius scandens]|uniref:Uncharacterized protein n=1 Tax=Marasmiellus scandens TaxID=2682957 RepID=A0ABR1J4P0_9AGAR
MASYHDIILDPSQSRNINILKRSIELPRSYSISWVQKEMDVIDGLAQQAVDELIAHKAIIPGVWDMIDCSMHVLLLSKWKPTWDPHDNVLTKCVVVELGGDIVDELRRIQDPRLQRAIDVLMIIIGYAVGAAYQAWIMEKAANRIAFEDPPVSASVDLQVFETLILRSFSFISEAIQTAQTVQDLRAPFDVLFRQIFRTYRSKRTIKTKYAPNCPNPTSNARTDGFVVYPLSGRKVISIRAFVMIDWMKDALDDGRHALGQLAIQYKHKDHPYEEVERRLTCDLVTTSTVNLVLGVHMPVFGLAIHQHQVGAYICEAKPAPHPRYQSGLNKCACTGMHHTVAEFMHFGDLRELANYLRFVSFLIAHKKWYFAEIVRYIPSDDDGWIQRRALSAFHTYGPWRNEDAEEIDTLRQSSPPNDSNNDDGDDGVGAGSFDGGFNPGDELGSFSQRHNFSLDSSSGGAFWGGGGGGLKDLSPVFIPDSFPMDPRLRSELRKTATLLERVHRDLKKKSDYCSGKARSLPGTDKEHSVFLNNLLTRRTPLPHK